MARVVKRVKYLGLAVEERDDGRFYVLRAGEVLHSAGSLHIAQAHMELLVEEMLEADPSLAKARDILKREQSFRDVISVRGEARGRAQDKAQNRGGKGGRGGV